MPSPEAPAAPASARESWEWEIIPNSIIYSIGERPALLPLPAQQPAAAAAAAAARVDAVANAAWRRCGASCPLPSRHQLKRGRDDPGIGSFRTQPRLLLLLLLLLLASASAASVH